ncbi:uncharacterized protein LY79DRAFT_399184 [Colletotrichum navitas]|uniref:Uncharacterized protein n=1 Tax=Colletotrichum navitas TaxID=681940 RepID=A0AAD8V004_9PEZI|nr:uncharacterized protein LY79DRAFT_399184 [Colletotrichum navitas]KAK1573778.1 hypothetical protein LY79DRAFT_399184 [Colletotrichum navitas]
MPVQSQIHLKNYSSKCHRRPVPEWADTTPPPSFPPNPKICHQLAPIGPVLAQSHIPRRPQGRGGSGTKTPEHQSIRNLSCAFMSGMMTDDDGVCRPTTAQGGPAPSVYIRYLRRQQQYGLRYLGLAFLLGPVQPCHSQRHFRLPTRSTATPPRHSNPPTLRN